MNLPRLLTIVTTVFGILMFASCQDSENCEKPPRDSTFKKKKILITPCRILLTDGKREFTTTVLF